MFPTVRGEDAIEKGSLKTSPFKRAPDTDSQASSQGKQARHFAEADASDRAVLPAYRVHTLRDDTRAARDIRHATTITTMRRNMRSLVQLFMKLRMKRE